MVFFSCLACGQSVKKNQVEKHYQFQCRNCDVLSCVDCGKDFRGDEYKSHIKCISEDEKYGSKGSNAPVVINKGEAKQDQWIQNIQEKISTITERPALANLLQKLLVFSNIPRKKGKFERFVQNSLKVYDGKLITEIWDVVNVAPKNVREADRDVGKTETEVKKNIQKVDCEEQKNSTSSEVIGANEITASDDIANEQKIKKKKHKKKQNVTNDVRELDSVNEKPADLNATAIEVETDDAHCKKKHKKKRTNDDERNGDSNDAASERFYIAEPSNEGETDEIGRKRKHKKKRKNDVNDDDSIPERLQSATEPDGDGDHNRGKSFQDADDETSRKKKRKKKKHGEFDDNCIEQENNFNSPEKSKKEVEKMSGALPAHDDEVERPLKKKKKKKQ